MAAVPAYTAAASAPAPFLLSGAAAEVQAADFHSLLVEALVAEARGCGSRRSERCRIAWMLCELRHRLGPDFGSRYPLARSEVATMLGISLVRAKRALALLSLSGMVAVEAEGLTVRDWRRLCGVAGYDFTRLALDEEDEAEALPNAASADHLLTATGDPACFV